MKFEWITDGETIWSDEFLSQWNSWMKHSIDAHVFFHPAMLRAWVDTYMPIRNLRRLFCIARDEGTTIFLPLALWQKNLKKVLIRTIVPVGHSDFYYHDPIVSLIKQLYLTKTYLLFKRHII